MRLRREPHLRPLPSEPVGFILGDPLSQAYRVAVRISETTRLHGLCCMSRFQGEIPVTDDDVAATIVIAEGQKRRHHRRCAHLGYLLRAMSQGEREALRRVIVGQTDVEPDAWRRTAVAGVGHDDP